MFKHVGVNFNHNTSQALEILSAGRATCGPRAGLTIEQTGQMPGASRFWGLALEYQNASLLVFHVIRLLNTGIKL